MNKPNKTIEDLTDFIYSEVWGKYENYANNQETRDRMIQKMDEAKIALNYVFRFLDSDYYKPES